MKTLLHIGCGHSTLKDLPAAFHNGQWGEIRYDIDPDANPDIVGSLQDMSLLEDSCVDSIYSSHNIEHVWAFEAPAVLSSFRRVLSEDGFALILCPDMLSVAQSIVAGYLEKTVYESQAGPITALDIVYGYHKDISRGNHFMAHKTAFTADTLASHLQDAGFAAAIIARDKMLGLHALAFPKLWSRQFAEDLLGGLLPSSELLLEVLYFGKFAD